MNGMSETPFRLSHVQPLWQSPRGAIMAILKWLHMPDHNQGVFVDFRRLR